MATYVVDTNVAVVANGGHPQASPNCAAACARALTNIVHSGTLALDTDWQIVREYKNKLSQSGQPGVGDAFLKWILVNHTNSARCSFVALSPSPGDVLLYDDIPRGKGMEGFDPSDQKFLAVALVHPERPAIMNAVDRDWAQYLEEIEALGVAILFLCPDACAPSEPPRPRRRRG